MTARNDAARRVLQFLLFVVLVLAVGTACTYVLRHSGGTGGEANRLWAERHAAQVKACVDRDGVPIFDAYGTRLARCDFPCRAPR